MACHKSTHPFADRHACLALCVRRFASQLLCLSARGWRGSKALLIAEATSLMPLANNIGPYGALGFIGSHGITGPLSIINNFKATCDTAAAKEVKGLLIAITSSTS